MLELLLVFLDRKVFKTVPPYVLSVWTAFTASRGPDPG
jgi:hypothetical protein